jgi:uncharacterized protein YegP (UPF0339 family)
MTAAYTIELFSRKRRGAADLTHYFRIRAANGQIVTPSQGYSRKIDRDEIVHHLRDNLATAEIVDA